MGQKTFFEVNTYSTIFL